MASQSTVQFGRVLEEGGGDRKIWFLVVPLAVALLALAVVGVYGISQSGSVEREVAAARAQAAELQKSVEERDRLLADARRDDRLLTAAGQASAIFYGLDAEAVESGLVVGAPADHAAKVLLYGLQPPKEGERYTLAARGGDGRLTALADVPVGADGTAFLLAKDVPEGATAIELLLRQGPPIAPGADGKGAQPGQAGAGAAESPAAVSLDGAQPRIAARYPQESERGVLLQAPAVQARQARRATR